MSIYSLVQAKDQLSKLIDEALSGTPVTITRDGKPVVNLTPAQTAPRAAARLDPDWLAERRATRPTLDIDSARIVRALRDEDPE